MNPFSEEKLLLLGEICGVSASSRVLDLACGKGELLCRWAQTFGSHGVGVDLSETFLAAARARAAGLDVSGRVAFVQGDAGAYEAEAGAFDVACCVGATSLAGTLDLIESAGAELVELVGASTDDWDRFEAAQWDALTDWLTAHPGDARSDQVRGFRDHARRRYVGYRRRYLGWAVFVLRP
jgi:SAM-dependent methyltransferase